MAKKNPKRLRRPENTDATDRHFVISPRRWQPFVDVFYCPAEVKPSLVRLFAEVRGKLHRRTK